MTHVVESESGELLEVTNIFDRQGRPTTELDLASSIVIKIDEDHWDACDAEIVTIYTVH